MKFKWSLLLLFGLCIPLISSGQSKKKVKRIRYNLFEGGMLVGFNASQIDGDYFTGYDKMGWYGGLRGVVNLTYRTSLNMELLYSQKGSRIPHGIRLTSQREFRDRLISVNYAEVPIYIKHRLYYTVNSAFLEFGPTFSRLINTKIEENAPQNIEGTVYNNITSEFKSLDMGVMLGFGVTISKFFEITARYNYGITRFYFDEDFVLPSPFSGRPKEVEFLRNYHFTVMAAYKFM